jgi:hypothetical protein
MRRLGILMAVIAASLGTSRGEAQTVDLSWDVCSPIVTNQVPMEETIVHIHASVLGQSQAHSAHRVWWVIGDVNDQLPDAWRFDGAGCNNGLYAISAAAPPALAKMCPSFVPNSTPQFTVRLFQLAPPSLGLPATMGLALIDVRYPSAVQNPDAGIRYHLAHFAFDMAFGVFGPADPMFACGGLETPVTIRLVPERTGWKDPNGVETLWQIGHGTLTMIGGPVPANASTWGQIKGQYR